MFGAMFRILTMVWFSKAFVSILKVTFRTEGLRDSAIQVVRTDGSEVAQLMTSVVKQQ